MQRMLFAKLMTSCGTDGIRTDTRRSELNRFCDNFCYFIKLALVHMKFAGTYADGSVPMKIRRRPK